MFKSATRVYLLILVMTLCFVTVYALMKSDMERFTVVIGLFGGVVGAIVNHFSGKSNTETSLQKETSVTKPVEVENPIVAEK